MIKSKTKHVIEVSDWDELVEKTYGKPYNFQQQDDCQERGTYDLTVPDYANDFERDTIAEVINGHEMGVSFEAWLKRDIHEWNGAPEDKRFLYLFWNRNFYPDIQTIANDLHSKGLLEEGEYLINIDW